MKRSHSRVGVLVLWGVLCLSCAPWCAAAESKTAGYFKTIVSYLSSSYIDADRFADVRPMLRSALRALENAADELMVEETREAGGEELVLYTVRLAGQGEKVSEREVMGEANDPIENLSKLARVLERVMFFVEEHFKGTPDEKDAMRHAMANGMTVVLDPHTNVFTPREYKEFFTHIGGEICGIGAYIGVRDGKLLIISPLEGTPAESAGLKPRDEIVRIDGESTVSMTTQEAVARIRGEEDSYVELVIRRKGHTGLIRRSIQRKNVAIPSVRSTLLDGGIGYIKVVNFAQNTGSSFFRQLKALERENGAALAGIVLDLRDNPGGLMDQAVALANMLMKQGDIVMTAHKGRVFRSPDGQARNLEFFDEPDCPVVVLVNHGAASGSEILAGALRNNDRALLVGQRTFGKGSVQQPRPLPDESCLKLTVYEYLLPGEVSIQSVGVTPDIQLDPAVVVKDEIAVFAEDTAVGERMNMGALESRFAREEKPAFRAIYYLDLPDEPVDADAVAESFVRSDFDREGPAFVAVNIAVRLIAMAGTERPFSRTGFLARHKDGIHALKEDLFREVVARLEKEGIDWRTGPRPAAPSYVLTLDHRIVVEKDAPRGKAPAADEAPPDVAPLDEDEEEEDEDATPRRKVRLTATLKNAGTEDLFRVGGIIASDHMGSPYAQREFLFGHVPAGGAVARTIVVTVPHYSIPRRDVFTVALHMGGVDALGSERFAVDVPEVPAPHLACTVALYDKDGAPAVHVTPGGKYRLKVGVKNVGEVEIFQAIARFKNELVRETSHAIDLERGREVLRGLKPGEERQVEFAFSLGSEPALSAYDFRLDVYETSVLKGVSKEFSLTPAGGAPFAPMTLRPPSVAAAVASLHVAAEDVDVTLQVSDDVELGYVMVMVVSRSRQRMERFPSKVFFRDVSGGKGPVSFTAQVPLAMGMNLVSVIATDNEKLKTIRSFLVKRT